jgi:hypothetical protein
VAFVPPVVSSFIDPLAADEAAPLPATPSAPPELVGVMPLTRPSEPEPLVETAGSAGRSGHASEHSALSKSPRPMTVPQAASGSGAKKARRRSA